MDVLKAVEERRAVKTYDPQHKMTQGEIDQLLDAARLAPTSFNIQNWRFVVVQDTEQRKKIRDAAWNQAQVTEASLVILICADLKAWEKNPKRYFKNTPEEIQTMMAGMIDNFYRGKEQTQRDEAMRSTGLAGQTIMLTAKAMGYDTCPMIGFDADAVAKIINLPSDHTIGMMIAVGKRSQDARPRSGPVDASEVIIYDRFAA